MKLRPWIPAILNLSFPGTGYIYIGKKLVGSILLLFTICYEIWNYLFRVNENSQDSWIGFIFSLIQIALAIHVYRQAKKKYLVNEKKEKLTVNILYRRIFIGLFMIFLSLDIFLFYSNIQLHFGWSKSVPNSVPIILEPIQYKISDFSSDVVTSLSILMIPILSYSLRLKKIPKKRIVFSFIGVTLMLVGMFIWSAKLSVRLSSEPQQAQKSFTSSDLMIAFNNERKNNNAQPLKSNKYVCKIAEERLNDVLTHGVETLNDQKGLERAYIKAQEMEINSQLTKESHVPDNVVILFTDKATIEDAMNGWTQDFETSYFFNDINFEFGCAVAKGGYGIIIAGSDDEPFTPKLDNNMPGV